MGLSRRLEAYLLPTFNALVQIPVLAWLPFFVLLLVGIGEALKIILIAKAALVPVTLNTLQGFRQASPALREVGRVYGYTRRQEVLEIVLPLATPTLFTGLRLGFTKAWLSLVVELVASSEGLGYLIVAASCSSWIWSWPPWSWWARSATPSTARWTGPRRS